MSPVDELVPVLKKLRLSGVLQSLDVRLRQAADGDLSHMELLYRLLLDEVERREGKQLQLRVGRAAFESQKSLDDFDFSFNPALPKAKLLDLATCRFIDTHTNVLLVGPAGVGKVTWPSHGPPCLPCWPCHPVRRRPTDVRHASRRPCRRNIRSPAQPFHQPASPHH